MNQFRSASDDAHRPSYKAYYWAAFILVAVVATVTAVAKINNRLASVNTYASGPGLSDKLSSRALPEVNGVTEISEPETSAPAAEAKGIIPPAATAGLSGKKVDAGNNLFSIPGSTATIGGQTFGPAQTRFSLKLSAGSYTATSSTPENYSVSYCVLATEALCDRLPAAQYTPGTSASVSTGQFITWRYAATAAPPPPPSQTGTLTIQKIDANSQPFTNPGSTVTLGGITVGPSQTTYTTALALGGYTSTSSVPANYTVSYKVCDTDCSTKAFTAYNPSVAVALNIQSSHTAANPLYLIWKYTNSQPPPQTGTIVIQKIDANSQPFTTPGATVTLGGITVGASQSSYTTTLYPGGYASTSTVPSSYTVSYKVCDTDCATKAFTAYDPSVTVWANINTTHTAANPLYVIWKYTSGQQPPPPPSGSGALNGAFLYAPDIASASVPAYFDEVKSLGMTILIISSTRDRSSGSCTNSSFVWASEFPSKLGIILDAAQARGIKIYVGLSSNGNCSNFYEEPYASQTVTDYGTALQTLQQTYGSHPALGGWYIPDEPGLWWMNGRANSYYQRLVSKIRQYSSKPVLVSPYLSTTVTPQSIASLALSFKNATGVTIQVWQDSVGAKGITTDPSAANSIQNIFSAISAAIGKSSFWSDNELFNCCSLTQGGGYKPASMARVGSQLAQSGTADKKVSWLPQTHMSSAAPYHMGGADRLLASYKAWSQFTGYEYITPQSYTWLTQPSTQYPDSGNELFNKQVGDPQLLSNSQWVGVQGPAEVKVDLGTQKTVDWVGAHLLDLGASVSFPASLKISYSNDGNTWTDAGTWGLPIAQGDSEYVFANPSPLGISARYLKVRLDNSALTFVSELEIVKGR